MKFSALLFIAVLIATSCCSAKQSQDLLKESNDNTEITESQATTSNGVLIGITQPVKATAEKPIATEFEVQLIDNTIEPVSTPPISTTIKENVIETLILDHAQLHKPFNVLLNNNVSNSGNVNYDGFKSNRKALLAYINALGENLPEDSWTKNEKLSYWMNAYNAMTINLILRNLPINSIKDIKNPWDQRLWKLGEKYYNLDEIEHQILRKMGDARIHFGINCASFSCPPLLNEAFVPSKVDAQLDAVAASFINDKTRNSISANSIEISNIFKWFSKDFKQNGSLIDYLNKYATIKISENAKVRYMDYDWSLNK